MGEPILADTDGDGRDEIIAPVADGYLYGIDTQVVKSQEDGKGSICRCQ